jgi:hypothetical protein
MGLHLLYPVPMGIASFIMPGASEVYDPCHEYLHTKVKRHPQKRMRGLAASLRYHPWLRRDASFSDQGVDSARLGRVLPAELVSHVDVVTF